MQLFQERASRVRADFTLSAETLPAMARICQLVEGNPLGIELAATWVRTQSCSAIAKEIEHSLDFLETNRRDVAERHRSLRTVFEGSWNLLTAAEQAILSRLTLFRGRFDWRAAEAVAGARPAAVAALVDKSLLRSDGQDRYDMHESSANMLLRNWMRGRKKKRRQTTGTEPIMLLACKIWPKRSKARQKSRP
jgi:predicted ATPase